MKIVDFERKGNLVRFYLGEDDLEEFYGDDWDDYPYDSNAGKVYGEFIKGHVDIVFPFDYFVLEPSNDWNGNDVSKEDMAKRRVPCIIAVPPEVHGDSFYEDSFLRWVGAKGIRKFYFNDNMDEYSSFIVLDEKREKTDK